ncbi:MAG: ribonuclease HI [Cyanobacteria bacterium J06598_1]
MPNTAQVKEIYTDGACSGNPGPGGWGTRIEFADGQVHELGGRDGATTNNRMEMQAAISALEFLSETDLDSDSGPVVLHTDSEYLKNGITKWIKGWKRKGWKTSAGKPVLNKDLWQQLDQLSQSLLDDQLSIDWRYVRGHAGNPGNERCDEIARAYSHAQPISLGQYSASSKKQRSSGKKAEKAVKSTKVTAESEKSTTEKPKKSQKERDNSIDTTEINTATTQEPSSTAALRFYETSPSSDQATENEMAATSKNTTSSDVDRVERIKNTLQTLQVTDELAKQGYLITSAELADLMDVNASAVTSRGDYWAWRNWTVSRIRREGNQILWQLERIDE